MEDRLAKSLRAAHDRHVEHLAAEQQVCKPPYEHHWYAVHAPHHDTQPAPVTHDDPKPAQAAHGPAPSVQPATRDIPADLPAVAPVSRVVPLAQQEISRPKFRSRFRWQGNSVSVVGTVVLSVLISTGLFSLQTISKWRRPKAVEAHAKVMGLDQPLTIASAQDEPAPFDESADSAGAAKASPSSVQSPADSSGDLPHGLTAVITPASNNDVSNNRSAVDITSHRAPYAPDSIGTSKSSDVSPTPQTVTPPEMIVEHAGAPGDSTASPSGLPPAPAANAVDQSQNTASNLNSAPGLPRDLVEQPAAGVPVNVPQSHKPSEVQGLFDRSGASQSPTGAQPSQQVFQAVPHRQGQDVANPQNVNLVNWTGPAAQAPNTVPNALSNALPASGVPSADSTNVARNSLDAPGPVILPGRPATAVASTAAAPGVPAAANPYGADGSAQADASPQLRDLTQPPTANPSQSAASAPQPATGADPVYGLFDHRQGAASAVNVRSDVANPLAALDRAKVMSFKFRNAPWTVVLSQFATETHLELRMQAVPQGVFNRWDAARYSPSQTLAILNSELARTGCQLKLEGNVLRVCAVSTAYTPAAARPSYTPAATTPAATSPTAWLPQSSGIVPVSGRY